jgi:hypothetical protein
VNESRSKNGVIKWLNNSGYPLELYAHQQFLKSGFRSIKSPLFEDLESGRLREIDLYASIKYFSKNYYFTFELIVECKRWDKPLVILCSQEDYDQRFEQILGSHRFSPHSPLIYPYSKLRDLSFTEQSEKIGVFAEKTYAGYSLVQAHANSDSKVYGTLLSLLKADAYYNEEYKNFFNDVHQDKDLTWIDRNPFLMTMPLLLIDADLFYCFLNDKGEIDVQETPWGIVTIELPWDVGGFSNRYTGTVQIVHRRFLVEYIKHTQKFFGYFSSQEALHDLIKNFQ